jgi:hypothetical protein
MLLGLLAVCVGMIQIQIQHNSARGEKGEIEEKGVDPTGTGYHSCTCLGCPMPKDIPFGGRRLTTRPHAIHACVTTARCTPEFVSPTGTRRAP